MIKCILIEYAEKEILSGFRGAKTSSAHIEKYFKWQGRRDVFQLVEKAIFK
jgi:hypothetical protein